MSAACFVVVSPEYKVYSQSEVDPAEYGRAVLFVRARNRQRAKVLAIRAWRRLVRHPNLRRKYHPYGGSLDYWDEGSGNPFAGVKVERVNEWQLRLENAEFGP